MEEKTKKESVKAEPKKAAVILVKSTMTADFPSLAWSIQAGEEKALPTDEAAQAEILSKYFITKK